MSGEPEATVPGPSGAERLAAVQDHWRRGDWERLAELAGAKQPEAERPETGQEPGGEGAAAERLLILAAAAMAQLGDVAGAAELARRALAAGCDRDFAARVLLGGVRNTLGRLAALDGDAARAEAAFTASAAVLVPEAMVAEAGRDRGIAERARLGLLPEAAQMIGTELQRLRTEGGLSETRAAVLESQIGLINHQIHLAMRRRQLYPGETAGTGPEKTGSATAAKTGAEATPPLPPPGDGKAVAAALASRATSQLGQDLWVIEQTGGRRAGFFVEFGATGGVLLSNSYLLETALGWNGICAEPNPAFFAQLEHNRGCTVAPDCILGEGGVEVEFLLADEYGGVADLVPEDSSAGIRRAYRETAGVLRLPTISLDDFLRKYGAPHRIDYLSIDTEGSEWEILRHFPLDNWEVALITVEHNFTPEREKIRALLEGFGYLRTEQRWDDWYARPDLLPGPMPADGAANGLRPMPGQ